MASVVMMKCFLHHYLEDGHHAKWHSSAASESEEYALCHSEMSPTRDFFGKE
jgi:hypothetical protein